jgi:hypothetical protein
LQYALHPSHPLPVSQASKNFLAISVTDGMIPSKFTMIGTKSLTTLSAAHLKDLYATAASFLVVPRQSIGTSNLLP